MLGGESDDELGQLCEEISQQLQQGRTTKRSGIISSLHWHHRMERLEENWEGSRQSIYECVIENEALPEPFVCKIPCCMSDIIVLYAHNIGLYVV